ncbi:uncharacterized protein LOC103486128 isoform X2 [Cucumis melo]|uniref:Uncharacterized protein LOC103486128 isoform X2 n=1 Tax=Cucumis melo TaxID=3656 RepID=A0ABM3L2E4_CUCME|nr:uncharacterized protein LOC103486128 isoform X2 [Cucumis melo]
MYALCLIIFSNLFLSFLFILFPPYLNYSKFGNPVQHFEIIYKISISSLKPSLCLSTFRVFSTQLSADAIFFSFLYSVSSSVTKDILEGTIAGAYVGMEYEVERIRITRDWYWKQQENLLLGSFNNKQMFAKTIDPSINSSIYQRSWEPTHPISFIPTA